VGNADQRHPFHHPPIAGERSGFQESGDAAPPPASLAELAGIACRLGPKGWAVVGVKGREGATGRRLAGGLGAARHFVERPAKRISGRIPRVPL